MNEYLDNLCHMNRSTGTTYAFSNRRNIYRNFERLQYSLEFRNCIERIDAKNIRIHCPPNSVSQYFKYTQCNSSVLQAVVDANLKFVTVDVGAYGKQNDGGVFRNSAVYQSLETRSLQVPEDTVLLHGEIRLPRIFVGDEAYTLTTSIMKPYSRRTLDRSKAMFNYRLSRARLVESAVGICSSKCRMLDKAIETKIDTGVCISLLHNIIIDFDGCLHSRLSQRDSLYLPPTRATGNERTNKLCRCYQSERPFCTLTRSTLRRRITPTYIHVFVRSSE